MVKRAWVTGGAGFIGSHLCESLLTRGYEVHCFDNLSSGRLENVVHLQTNEAFHSYRVDVDVESLSKFNEGRVDVVYHLAGHASPRDYFSRPLETLMSSASGLKNALDVAHVFNCPLIFASTSEVYGSPSVVPTPEDTWGTVNTLGPRAVYDEGKRFGETLCWVYQKAMGVDARIARIFNTYGPRLRPDDGRVVSSFIVSALKGRPVQVQGDGSHTRSFCYVSDTVEGLIAVAEKGQAIRPYNIGNQHEITILKLAEEVGKVTGVPVVTEKADPSPDDPPRRCPDISRAWTELQWEPRVDLENGLNWTVKWFRNQDWRTF